MKKAFAIILALVLSLSTLTACGSDTQDKLAQLQADFEQLLTDSGELSALYLEALMLGLDVSPFTDAYNRIMQFISEFAFKPVTDLGVDALDMLIAQITELQSLLTDIMTGLDTLITGGGILPTQPPTEPPTQPPTEPPTQPPTETTTQPPTETTTQPPTETTTQPPTETTTEPASTENISALIDEITGLKSSIDDIKSLLQPTE